MLRKKLNNLGKEVNMNHIEKFESLGFEQQNTGGGCMWLCKELHRTHTGEIIAVITDGEAGLPTVDCAQLYIIARCDGGDIELARGEEQVSQTLFEDLHNVFPAHGTLKMISSLL